MTKQKKNKNVLLIAQMPTIFFKKKCICVIKRLLFGRLLNAPGYKHFNLKISLDILSNI